MPTTLYPAKLKHHLQISQSKVNYIHVLTIPIKDRVSCKVSQKRISLLKDSGDQKFNQR